MTSVMVPFLLVTKLGSFDSLNRDRYSSSLARNASSANFRSVTSLPIPTMPITVPSRVCGVVINSQFMYSPDLVSTRSSKLGDRLPWENL